MEALLFKAYLPEAFLSFCLLSHLLFNVFLVRYVRLNGPIIDLEQFIQVLFILCCTSLLLFKLNIEFIDTSFNLISTNGLTNLKQIIIILSSLILIPTWRQFVYDKLNMYEFFTLYLLSLIVLLLLINVNDLLILYLLIEMQTLLFVIMASFKRASVFSTEAGLKYFIAGAFFSGLYLLGCSFLYGVFGTINFWALELLTFIPLLHTSFYIVVLLSFLLIMAVLLFKLAVAPFHFWSPDVYEGAPMSATIILSTVPKLAIFTVLVRWISITYPIFINFNFIAIILGILSIIFAILFANRQKRVKRFLAFSSIGQLGYAMLLIAVFDFDSCVNIYFLLLIYLITSIALWTFISIYNYSYLNVTNFFKKTNYTLYISNFSNVGKQNPILAISLVTLLASLAGIPPFSGFLPKLFVFNALIAYDKIFIIGLVVILTCLVIWYYINFIIIFFMEIKPVSQSIKQTLNLVLQTRVSFLNIDLLLGVILTLFVMYFFIKPNMLILACNYCLLGLFN
jgi:NADH-quinone oxidoreductase subunit N